VALRRNSRLRRALAALLLRLARRLVPHGPESEGGEGTVAPAQAPAHWLARIRADARRLTIRTDPSGEAARNPPEPAPRATATAKASPTPVKTTARDTDWKQLVRDRARELGLREASESRPRKAEDRERRNTQAKSGLLSPPIGTPAAGSHRIRTVETLSAQIVPSRETPTSPPPRAHLLHRRLMRERPTAPMAEPVRVTTPVSVDGQNQDDTGGDALPAPARQTPRATERITAPPTPLRPIPETRARTRVGADTLGRPQNSVQPAHEASEPARKARMRVNLDHQLSAMTNAASRKSEARAHREERRRSHAVPVHMPPLRGRVTAPDEPRWPSLPDEPGDFSQVPDRWPQPPREAPESSAEDRMRERITDASHEAYLHAEQKGERWNA
jgi:hypothetical protein